MVPMLDPNPSLTQNIQFFYTDLTMCTVAYMSIVLTVFALWQGVRVCRILLDASMGYIVIPLGAPTRGRHIYAEVPA